MSKNITYVRYYFPNGLRWSLTVLLLPLAIYLFVIGWLITALICLFLVFMQWSFKYVMSINTQQKRIRDEFYRLNIPSGKTYNYSHLNSLLVTAENKGYKAASRSRDYWVSYMEYALHLKYDGNKQLTLVTINDPDVFKAQTDKFAQQLNLPVER